MHLSDFDYELPEELIAQHPLSKRDASRMLIVHRATGAFEDRHFVSLPDYLRAGDCLVLNNTKVFPARLLGRRLPTGGSVEILLLREIEAGKWQVLARPARRLQVGSRIEFAESKLTGTVVEVLDDGTRVIHFEPSDDLLNVIEEIGETPLPPYIKRHSGAADEDRDRYQTIYAQQTGAIAAPTAGLHFTARVLQELKQNDVRIAEITLHVGYGTFEPVRVDNVAEHRVLAERFTISEEAACTINDCRRTGGRVVAVGTTTTRALESSISGSGVLAANGLANLTITPGYSFRAVDALLTNFHLPRSSLLLLVSAFAGSTLVLEAYRHAVRERYRFYSYGDCMLIL